MTPTPKFTLCYRPKTRRKKASARHSLHALFPDRKSAEAVAAEARRRFPHLEIWIEETNPEQATNAEGETR